MAYTYVQKGTNKMRIDSANLGTWTGAGYKQISQSDYEGKSTTAPTTTTQKTTTTSPYSYPGSPSSSQTTTYNKPTTTQPTTTAPKTTTTTPSSSSGGLSSTQKQQLDLASQRIASGSGSATDVANVNYAKQKYGYSYTAPQTTPVSQPKTTTPTPTQTTTPTPTTTTSGLTTAQKQSLDIASQRISNGTASAADVANVNYAKQKYGYSYTAPQTTTVTPTPQATTTTQPAKSEPYQLGEGGKQTADYITPGYKGVYEGKENLIANENAVNHLFKQYHGRDATQEELDYWTYKKIGEIENTLAKTTFYSQPKAEEIKKEQAAAGQTYIPNQAQLEALSKGGLKTTTTPETTGSMVFAPTTAVEKARKNYELGGTAVPDVLKEGGAKIAPVETGTEKPTTTPTGTTETPASEQLKSLTDQLQTELSQLPQPKGGTGGGYVSPADAKIDMLRSELETLMQPTDEESKLQQQLDALRSSAEAGLTKLEGETVPMRFIVGQQAQVERMANDKMNTLTRQLATLQQQRQSELEAKQAMLTEAKQDQEYERSLTAPKVVGSKILQYNTQTGQYDVVYEAPAGVSPMSVGAGETIIDSNTGEVLYQAPEAELGAGDILDLQKKQLEIDKMRKELEAEPDPLEQQKKLLELAKLQAEITKIQSSSGADLTEPPTVKEINGVDSQWNPTTQTWDPLTITNSKQVQQELDRSNTIIDIIDYLETAESATGRSVLSKNVGPISSRLSTPFDLSGSTADWFTKLEQLKTLLTKEGLSALRGLGAMSDRELQLIQNSVTALNVQGTEQGFRDELERIRKQFEPAITKLQQNASDIDFQQEFGTGGSGGIEGDWQDFRNDLGTSLKGQELGSLSERYESGGDPGAIGYDSTGGYSYGAYQLAHNNAQRFINQSNYADEFQGLEFNSNNWQNKWKEIATREPEKFKTAQKDYIKQNFYEPQLQKLAEYGVNTSNLPPALQDVIWSTAVQHGGNTDVIIRALESLSDDATLEDIINAIYDERGTRFSGSTPEVQNAVQNRFINEKKLALNMLNTYS